MHKPTMNNIHFDTSSLVQKLKGRNMGVGKTKKLSTWRSKQKKGSVIIAGP